CPAGARPGGGGAGDGRPAASLHDQFRRLFGEDAVRGQLTAGEGEEAGDAVTGLVVDDLVAAGQLVLVHAPLEDRVPDAGPGAQHPPAAGLRDHPGGRLDHVGHFIVHDFPVDVCRVAVVVVVRGADDRLGAVGDQEHGPAVDALQDHAVVSDAALEGDVDP